MEITVRIKEVYGRTTIYPVCDKAKIFSRMMKQQTLTQSDIDNIKALGYTVIVEMGKKSL